MASENLTSQPFELTKLVGGAVGAVAQVLTSVGPQPQDDTTLLAGILGTASLRQNSPKLTPIRGAAAQAFPAGGGENNPAVSAPYTARLMARRAGIGADEDGVSDGDFWHSVEPLRVKDGDVIKAVGRTLVMKDVHYVDTQRYIEALGANLQEGGFFFWDGAPKEAYSGIGLEFYMPSKTDIDLAESIVSMIEAEEANAGAPETTLRWSDAVRITLETESRDGRPVLLVLAIFQPRDGLPPPALV